MRILLPIDGSIYSDRAIEYICNRSALREKTNTLYLLNVQKKVPAKAAQIIEKNELEEILDDAAKEVLRPAKKALEAAGYKVKTKVAYGKATNRIVEYAKEIKANLIVMGSHGRTPVKNVLFGSKTSAVIASCKIPMLVIRHKFKDEPGAMQVGVCLDGSEYSQSVMNYIIDNLPLFGKEPTFHLVNVVTPYSGILMPGVSAFGGPAMTAKEFESEQRSPFVDAAKPFYNKLRSEGYNVVIAELKGDPSEEISKYVDEKKLGLLVMGTHGGGMIRIMMVGSTTMRVACMTDLPILLIHKERVSKKSKTDKK